MSAHSRLLPTLALIVLSLIWGYTWVLGKQGLEYAPPFAFAAQRCAGGALALLLALWLSGRSLALPPAGPMLAIAFVQGSGFLALQTWALVEGGPGKTAVLIFTMPIWTLLLAWPLLGERVRGRQWLAAAFTLGGLILVIEPWAMHGSHLSKLLGILAALCWAIGTILIKRLRIAHRVDLLNLTAWQLALGAVPLVALALAVPERPTDWTAHFAVILLVMSVVSTAFCWWLWIWILDRVPAWEASLSVLGTPVVAIVASRLTFGEAFSSPEIAGILLIGSGLVVLSALSWAASRRQPGRNGATRAGAPR
ncbi:MAG TPA: DMT family transporter [Rhodocyclaceae bacterium]|nr:DMT family transporter [Rhodocyclaceae bacterium]HMZ84901.1 DMT family transporter [Rhodocyclaceae bacterium]HNA04115.1 DMT family transporter [Rhodocyclaceae bacterium]HNB79877.1 DMT family transporter [Rhodocyclaceae bacterium]HNC62029.1 DMT family transporter [Rhodocyclaceae bacterium]